MTKIADNILTVLVSNKCFGSDNAMKLKQLATLTGLNRRTISEHKFELLEYGVMTSKSRYGGIFICQSVLEFDHYYHLINSHLKAYKLELERLDMLYDKISKNWK